MFDFRYLHPSVSCVWEGERNTRVAALTSENSKGVLGMDMRADSMGHCAKFGSYSTMDMTRNKVLHVELVQVIITILPFLS